MTGYAREKFATRVDTELLAGVRSLARNEGRQIQALVDEALADLIEKRRHDRPRAPVMAAYQTSHGPYGTLHKKFTE